MSQNTNRLNLQTENNGLIQLVLEEANYSADELTTTLNTILGLYGFTVTYSYLTNKLSFTANQTYTFLATSTILYQIGFSPGDHSSSGPQNTLISDKVVDLSGTKFVYIYTQFHTRNLVNGRRSTLLCKIPAGADSNAMILYYDTNSMSNYLGSQSISKIYFRMEDDTGQIIDLEGKNWSITLQIDIYTTVNAPTVGQGNPLMDPSVPPTFIEPKEGKEEEQWQYLEGN